MKALHVGTVNGNPLRLFRSPRPIAEMPWVAMEDLKACLPVTRQQYRKMCRESGDEFELVTAVHIDGLDVEIGPHSLVRRFFAMVAADLPPVQRGEVVDAAEFLAKITAEYATASRAAFHVMTSVLSVDQKQRYAAVAMQV